jgi:flagellar motility protein MotE (MotC chaperone)
MSGRSMSWSISRSFLRPQLVTVVMGTAFVSAGLHGARLAETDWVAVADVVRDAVAAPVAASGEQPPAAPAAPTARSGQFTGQDLLDEAPSLSNAGPSAGAPPVPAGNGATPDAAAADALTPAQVESEMAKLLAELKARKAPETSATPSVEAMAERAIAARAQQVLGDLKQVQKDLREAFQAQTKEERARIEKLAAMYESMKPPDAARIVTNLPEELAVRVFTTMTERKAAPILAAMEPLKAARISAGVEGILLSSGTARRAN